MTVKEYLGQAYLLDQRIKSDMLEIDELRDMAQSISAVGYEEHFNPNHSTQASFIYSLEKIAEMEEKVMAEAKKMVRLKEQIQEVIRQVDKPELQAILKYRYVHNYTWTHIGDLLSVDESTVRRWNDKAVSKITLPENAINLKVAGFARKCTGVDSDIV